MVMSQEEYEELSDVLNDIFSQNEVQRIVINVETECGKEIVVECAMQIENVVH